LVVLGAQAVVPFAANAQDKRQNAAVHAEETFGIVEASVFGGITNFGRVGAGLGTSLGKGADVGVRFTVNPNDFLGIELNGSAYGDHKLKFSNQPRPGVNLPQLDVHVYQMAINALGYFTPRENKVRPFLTVGFGPSFYTPNDRATAAARSFDPSFGLSNFSSDTRLTLNYGAGSAPPCTNVTVYFTTKTKAVNGVDFTFTDANGQDATVVGASLTGPLTLTNLYTSRKKTLPVQIGLKKDPAYYSGNTKVSVQLLAQ